MAHKLNVRCSMDKKSADPRLVWLATVLMAAVTILYVVHS